MCMLLYIIILSTYVSLFCALNQWLLAGYIIEGYSYIQKLIYSHGIKGILYIKHALCLNCYHRLIQAEYMYGLAIVM